MYKRRFLSVEENAENVNYNSQLGLRHTILRESSLVDEFYFEEHSPVHDKEKSYSHVDPIYMLLNQERLNNLGAGAAKMFLDSLAPKSDSLAELRSKCSDDDLMSMIKSRHLQSPAEILAWCRYIQNNVDEFNAELQKLVTAQTEQVESSESSESKSE